MGGRPKRTPSLSLSVSNCIQCPSDLGSSKSACVLSIKRQHIKYQILVEINMEQIWADVYCKQIYRGQGEG